MKLLIYTLLLLPFFAPPLAPAGPGIAQSNTLSGEEIASGWVSLFDGETAFGWKAEGAVTVKDGVLTLDGEKVATLIATGEKGTSLTNRTEFGVNFELQLDYAVEGQGKGLLRQAILFVSDDGCNLERSVSGRRGWHHLAVRREYDPKGRKEIIRHSIDGGFPSGSDRSPFPPSTCELRFEVPFGVRLAVRNIRLRPLELRTIFNGKDLSGWKAFPGKKSKFTVTKEGWLNVKDGPGDLQTEDQWADFVLQLDCLSNGGRLNSGVFFRCRPGEYQQGYEARIHNGFTDQPEKEYTIEEYDPQTHELKGKTKVKSAAIDYGTGGIYRRVPARKPVSKDGEWFTITVMAHGRHIATWVNGVQQVDWTDNRPLKDNARNGCRLEKGPISLQGHDPTTDLSFRNLRLAGLPKKD